MREPLAVQGDLFWMSHLEAAAHTGECAISALAQRYVPSAMAIAGAGGRLGVALSHWGLALVVGWLPAWLPSPPGCPWGRWAPFPHEISTPKIAVRTDRHCADRTAFVFCKVAGLVVDANMRFGRCCMML